MEDDLKELEILKEGINYLKKALECFVCCDNVTNEEYEKLGAKLYDLEDKAKKLEIEIHGCILQEV